MIFMDPPYKSRQEFRALEYLKNSHLVDMDTKIIIEADIYEPFEDVKDMGYKVIKEKKYKTNKHVFLNLGE